ncbi:MAG TPA: Asp-tRNA(Asn)/Glu-tRNA(Gln) amidotransferase subunit GatC [Candidatus Acidoferrales bacterium]|nr:Asp-tRNA(Asn)/Glu-tRNA(Gln) amidotransferase subunit GatC [Candidatus Acidoferrales bacterium]
MKITRKDVEYVAALAHLELTAPEVERMQQQLDSILGYVDKLNELDTTDVEPMAQVLTETRPDVALRADATRIGLARPEALAAAPDADETFVRVPKVIER